MAMKSSLEAGTSYGAKYSCCEWHLRAFCFEWLWTRTSRTPMGFGIATLYEKNKLNFREEGYPQEEHVKEQQVEGHSVPGEQSEKFVVCGRKREAHQTCHQCICPLILTFPCLILSFSLCLNLWWGGSQIHLLFTHADICSHVALWWPIFNMAEKSKQGMMNSISLCFCSVWKHGMQFNPSSSP